MGHKGRSLRFCVAGVLVALAPPVAASQAVVEWYHGSWSCQIDGRPARMTWKIVDDTQVNCAGDECSVVNGVATRGRFSDNGSRWVTLTAPSVNGDTLRFRHADGNPWRLRRESATRAVGHTTWNGSRFPLSCDKR